MPHLRSGLFLLCFLCLLCLFCFQETLTPAAQEQPADAAEISRDLLYHPARRIEITERGIVFRAAQFTYRFDPTTGQWEVQREKNFTPAEASAAVKTYRDVQRNVEYRFTGGTTEDEGILEIRRGEESEAAARARLWNREQLASAWLAVFQKDSHKLTREQLARDVEPDEPEVSDVADDGTYLWLAIRHSAGEGYLGLGTVVRFDPKTNETKLHQARELGTSSVTHIAAAGGQLWLGAARLGESSVEPTMGLARFNPATGELRSSLPRSDEFAGQVVTALRAAGDMLWVATDAGICRLVRPGEAAEEWTCWRIVPMARTTALAPVSNRPGGPPRGRLPAGSYEVRWANTAFLEVVTPDAAEGWIASDDLEEYTRQGFQAAAYELTNTYGGGASVMRLLEKPESDPLSAVQVYRAPLKRIGSASESGWQRVRAHIGWISRKGPEVAPVLQPASP